MLGKIFSITNERVNEKEHKVINILGLKIKIKQKFILFKIFRKVKNKFAFILFKNSPIAYFKYSYNSEIFTDFKNAIKDGKYYSVNIGDYIQAEAIKQLLNKIYDGEIVSIDRDTLNNNKKKIRAFCNAIMYDCIYPKYPTEPILLGLSLADSPETLTKKYKYLKLHEPIGCRDEFTFKLLKDAGIKAFVSFCYTMTLPKRIKTPLKPKVFFVGVSEEFKKYIPAEILEHAEFIIQRKFFEKYPLNNNDMLELQHDAKNLLDRYRNEATLVVSPLLHCISPCLAMGIPVILARETDNPRFSAIKNFIKLYEREEWNDIDWNPTPIDIEYLKNLMTNIADEKINKGSISKSLVKDIEVYYENLKFKK